MAHNWSNIAETPFVKKYFQNSMLTQNMSDEETRLYDEEILNCLHLPHSLSRYFTDFISKYFFYRLWHKIVSGSPLSRSIVVVFVSLSEPIFIPLKRWEIKVSDVFSMIVCVFFISIISHKNNSHKRTITKRKKEHKWLEKFCVDGVHFLLFCSLVIFNRVFWSQYHLNIRGSIDDRSSSHTKNIDRINILKQIFSNTLPCEWYHDHLSILGIYDCRGRIYADAIERLMNDP